MAYFGGSITAARGWRPKTLAWLRERFPKAKVNEINATISGTGSDLGVFRLEKDVLSRDPDLIFLEFTVNDIWASQELTHRSVEGIIRKAWRKNPAIDFCFVYTFLVGFEKHLDAGRCPPTQAAHERVAAHYGIPSINPSLRIAQLAQEGKLIFKGQPDDPDAGDKLVFSRDGCHPLDGGHEIYRDVIADAISKMDTGASPKPHRLGKPFREDNWENARLVPISADMVRGTWKELGEGDELHRRFGYHLPHLWHSGNPGDELEFAFTGTRIGFYDAVGPDGGQLRWEIDGEKSGVLPRFDADCYYYRLTRGWLTDGLSPGKHRIKVRLDSEQPDREQVWRRVRDKPDFNPKDYEGTNVRLGYWMILGEPVEE